MISPNNSRAAAIEVVDVERAASLVPDDFSLPKNSGLYAPKPVQTVNLTPDVGIESGQFFNKSAPAGASKRMRTDNAPARSTPNGLTHFD